MFLLDTNILIYAIKKNNSALTQKLFSVPYNEIFVSSITVAELEYGAANSKFPEKNFVAMRKFLAPFGIIDFDKDDAKMYGEVKFDLKNRGCLIGPFDMLIGAQAKARDAILVTNNVREFERIKDLKIEDWTVTNC